MLAFARGRCKVVLMETQTKTKATPTCDLVAQYASDLTQEERDAKMEQHKMHIGFLEEANRIVQNAKRKEAEALKFWNRLEQALKEIRQLKVSVRKFAPRGTTSKEGAAILYGTCRDYNTILSSESKWYLSHHGLTEMNVSCVVGAPNAKGIAMMEIFKKHNIEFEWDGSLGQCVSITIPAGE
jgi:hypothetical protein